MAKTSTKKKVVDIKKHAAAKAATAPKSSTKAAPTAEGAKKKAPTNSKYIGKSTGLRVQAFQDQLMARNNKAKLTDAQLAKAMREEFPNAVKFTEDHVAGIRSQWNNGKRASQEGKKPEKVTLRYNEEGEAISPRARGEGKAKSGAAKKGAATKETGKKKAAPVEEEEDEDEEDDAEESDDDVEDDGDEDEEDEDDE